MQPSFRQFVCQKRRSSSPRSKLGFDRVNLICHSLTLLFANLNFVQDGVDTVIALLNGRTMHLKDFNRALLFCNDLIFNVRPPFNLGR